MNDLFNKLFLKFCLHVAVSIVTIIIWYLLNLIATGENFYTGLYICLFISNCTSLILSKLTHILSHLSEQKSR